MSRFDWKKMAMKGLKTGLATGTVTGGVMGAVEGVESSDQVLVTAIATVALAGIRMFGNWWKNR